MISAPLFTVQDAEKTHPIYDRLFINGSRFAKVNGAPLKLTERRFFHVVVEQKRLSSMAYHIAELTRRHPEHYVITDEGSVAFTLREPAWAQLDGEVMYLEAGTNVHVHLDAQPFHALSTLLA